MFLEIDAIIVDLEKRLIKEKSLKRKLLLESAISNLKEWNRLSREL